MRTASPGLSPSMNSNASRVEAVVVTGRPIGMTIGRATPMKTSRKSQRRSMFRSLSTNPAMLLPTSETEIALLDAQDQADGHRGGAERRADDDARLGRAVRGLHDPLGELPQGLARARGGGLERRERSRQEFQQRNPARHHENSGDQENGRLGIARAKCAKRRGGHEKGQEGEDRGLERQEEPIGDPLERGSGTVRQAGDSLPRDRAPDAQPSGDEEPRQEHDRVGPSLLAPGDLSRSVLDHVHDSQQQREPGHDDEPLIEPRPHPRLTRKETFRNVEREDGDDAREEGHEERPARAKRRSEEAERDPHDRQDREEHDERDASELEVHCVLKRFGYETRPKLVRMIPRIPSRITIALAMSWARIEPSRMGSRVR